MKSLIRKLLFGDHPIKQYLTVSLKEKEIIEKAYLVYGENRLEISKVQFAICQDPYMMGIWLGEKTIEKGAEVHIEMERDNQLILKSKCIVNEMIGLTKGNLLIAELKRTTYQFINYFHQKGIIAFFYYRQKHKVSFTELDHFCAMYSYPRSVILTCFGTEEDYNLFPMDLRGFIKEAGIYLLGLRNTNVTLKKMLAAKKVVVCGIAADQKENIFALGAHHSTQPPSLKDLPFDFISSEKFGFPVPTIIKDYKEIEIIESHNKGSHTLMICKVVNEVVFEEDFPSLYHLHIATAMKLGCDYEEL